MVAVDMEDDAAATVAIAPLELYDGSPTGLAADDDDAADSAACAACAAAVCAAWAIRLRGLLTVVKVGVATILSPSRLNTLS